MRGEGHIVNVGSISGKEVYPNGTVYCATKHAVDALTKGMRMDMLKHNIKVTQICPGAVETEFSFFSFRCYKERAAAVYEGYENRGRRYCRLYPLCVSRLHVAISDLVVMPTAQASATLFNKK